MEWIETTGKTVAEARELALDQLGVHDSEAEFEVVQEPKAGLFGRTRGIARVRARVIPKAAPPKTDRKRRPKKKSGSDSQGNSAGRGNQPSGNKGAKASQSNNQSTDKRGGGQKSSGQGKVTVSESNNQESSGSGSSGSDSGRPNRERSTGRAQREPMDNAEQIRVVEEFLTGLINAFGVTATIETTINDKDLVANISGDNLGLLVGPRLATLDALQEVTRLALQREADGKEYARVGVDVAGIRTTRRESLETFVRSVAERAQNEGKTIVFEEMSSADRKQVHDLASEIEGVRSVSEGEDPRRRVAIVPAD